MSDGNYDLSNDLFQIHARELVVNYGKRNSTYHKIKSWYQLQNSRSYMQLAWLLEQLLNGRLFNIFKQHFFAPNT